MVAPVLLGVSIASHFMMCFCSVISAENVIRLRLFILLITSHRDFDALNLAGAKKNVYSMVAHASTPL